MICHSYDCNRKFDLTINISKGKINDGITFGVWMSVHNSDKNWFPVRDGMFDWQWYEISEVKIRSRFVRQYVANVKSHTLFILKYSITVTMFKMISINGKFSDVLGTVYPCFLYSQHIQWKVWQHAEEGDDMVNFHLADIEGWTYRWHSNIFVHINHDRINI